MGGIVAVSEETVPETAVEGIKRASNFLRGELANDLANEQPDVTADSEQLLKFHGIYAQDNRDVRRERAKNGETLDYIFMIRVVVPGGRLTTSRWLALDRIASELADGTIRLTTRQAVQFHGVVKDGLRPLAISLDRELLSSFGGCGDVVRNVVSCPSLQVDETDERLADITRTLSRAFRPTTGAHWEIFINGDKAATRDEGPERPIYGETYLPRKFKIAVAHPEDNCVDVFAQDVGLIPGSHSEVGDGFNLIVGGGLGRSYANPDTFARLGDPLTFVTYDEVEEVIGAVIATYRDLGDRTERRRARMKYVVADLGLDVFRAEVEGRLGRSLRAPLALPENFDARDHLGWRTHRDGSHEVGIRVSAGRVRDLDGGSRLRSALRQVATDFDVTFHITPQQDILISHIAPEARSAIEQILVEHRVRLTGELGPVERNALACPALPTCSQALTEAERRLPELVGNIESTLANRSLARRPLQLRMTGCPNGCARPAVAEVGVVGRTKSTYDVYVGGGVRGDRLSQLYREKVPFDQIAVVLDPLFERWEQDGLDDEPFGDFIARTGAA
jgi:sulfite reductase (ferredoxin)